MTRFTVPDMSCSHCTATIEKSIRAVDPAAKVVCDLASHTVAIDSALNAGALGSAIRGAGYDATPVA
jgi:copper chaperone